MKQVVSKIKENAFNIHYAIIACLAILVLFKSCETAPLKTAKEDFLEKELIDADKRIKRYADENNKLQEKLIILSSKRKEIEKKENYRVDQIKKNASKVSGYNKKDIAKYYSKRYNSKIVSSGKGNILSDSISKENIKELFEKDALVIKLESSKKQLAIEEKKSLIKDTIIIKKDSIIINKDAMLNSQKEQLRIADNKRVKAERSKRVWKTVAEIGLAIALILSF